jgi:hypothetical protein
MYEITLFLLYPQKDLQNFYIRKPYSIEILLNNFKVLGSE